MIICMSRNCSCVTDIIIFTPSQAHRNSDKHVSMSIKPLSLTREIVQGEKKRIYPK